MTLVEVDERPVYPANLLAPTSDGEPQPRPLCYQHANERREAGSIDPDEVVRNPDRSVMCEDCKRDR